MVIDLEELRPHATERQLEYLEEWALCGFNKAAAARTLGIDRRALGRGIDAVFDKAEKAGAYVPNKPGARVLILDIETSPLLAHLWNLFTRTPQSYDMVIEDTYMMSIAWKWADEEEIQCRTLYDEYGPHRVGDCEDDSPLLRLCWRLLDEANVVVAHNGDNFDLKTIRTRMLANGLTRPSPYRQVDTLKIAKREFKFPNNRLNTIAQYLYGDKKNQTGGIELWKGCLAWDEEAWAKMKDYNIQDVALLSNLYNDIRSWDRSHPNLAIMNGAGTCGVCGSEDLEKTERVAYTNAGAWEVWRCNDCGGMHRGRQNIKYTAHDKVPLIPAR